MKKFLLTILLLLSCVKTESQVNEKMPFDNTYDNHLALAFIYGTLWNIDPFQIYAVWAYRENKNK